MSFDIDHKRIAIGIKLKMSRSTAFQIMSYLDCVMAITQLNGVLVIIARLVSKLVYLMLEI